NPHRHRGGRSRCACRRHPRWAHSACAAARTVYRAWRRNPDHGRLTAAMRSLLAALAMLAASGALASPAQAALKLCNRTSYVLYAATAAVSDRGSSVKGWTRIAPGDCQTARPERLSAQSYLV